MNGYWSGPRPGEPDWRWVDTLLGSALVSLLLLIALACQSKPVVTRNVPIQSGERSPIRIYAERPDQFGEAQPGTTATFHSRAVSQEPLDTDGDGDIDLADYAVLINSLTGPQ